MKTTLLILTILLFVSCKNDAAKSNLKNVKVDVVTKKATADFYFIQNNDTITCCEDCEISEKSLEEFKNNGSVEAHCIYDNHAYWFTYFRMLGVILILLWALYLKEKSLDRYQKALEHYKK